MTKREKILWDAVRKLGSRDSETQAIALKVMAEFEAEKGQSAEGTIVAPSKYFQDVYSKGLRLETRLFKKVATLDEALEYVAWSTQAVIDICSRDAKARAESQAAQDSAPQAGDEDEIIGDAFRRYAEFREARGVPLDSLNSHKVTWDEAWGAARAARQEAEGDK